jgi:hypothetical protein
MLTRILKEWLQPPDAVSRPCREQTGHRRRGVTAMEYLVAISFILIVLILAVQHLGSVTRGLLGNSAKATNLTGTTAS